MLNSERQGKVVELCSDLMRAKSMSGEEQDVVDIMEKFFRMHQFDTIKKDKYGNIIGCIKGNRPGKKILYEGHMDEVPVADPKVWTHDPFGAEIENGRIYGRGATDMKGGLSAACCAAAFFAEDTNRDFAGEIYVAGSCHEECFEGVAARSISEIVQPDIVVICEPSHLDLRIGQRGRAEIVVETFGRPAHSSNPEKGVNAVYKMMQIIEGIKGLPVNNHPVLGKGILELTDIKSSPYPGASVVPQYCRATYDRRTLVDETKESVLAPIQDLIKKLQENDPELEAKVSYAWGSEKCYTGAVIEGERFFPAWLYNEGDDFVQAAYQELQKNNFSSQISTWQFCTNGSHYAGEAKIRTIGLGPSWEHLAHITDEYIELEQLYGAVSAYMSISKGLLDM
ncbi:YgeY family selenium metabolism-linked hydrolase [Desulfitobacterium hafniense]|uniref:Peptidase M20 dimerisation domain-containing protein n=5 Tax=root TaxID=1 RepID=Q24WJ6_DESHY|nr:YgeY family selenium metabolism-linked hydrolase [Desulfitobacterium hafniense]ACL20984.1 peptidase dimerisation domain protein [Desulfitobacterium hafniense DCB-2]EHL06950.1 peptidase [Desulfitobacterium hafniense DP7]KTE91256.1 peptidase M20 [Desulfitobacterium hafniense]MEA5025409.1 YgeY family selenium metabolism-linked hydrolase [Desulfitobacterium hafniense]CDX01870.1 Peptidase M20 [Desulfitobacterium hafniense]